MIELQVGVRKDKQTARERLLHQLLRKLAQLLRFGRRGDHEIHGKVAAAGQWRRGQGNRANAWDLRQRSHGFHQELLRRLAPLAPRFGDHSAETGRRKRELKRAAGFGKRSIDVVDLRGEQPGLLNRGVRRRLNDREHDALIFGGRELTLREHVERHDQRGHDQPEDQDDRPVAERCG